ncbi:MAG: ligase-associated DNA damage response DEXH box helicase [Nitrosospira sp.]
MNNAGHARAEQWLALCGWHAFPFQRRVWRAMSHGRSGLLHVTTGAGKTLAVWLGALERFVPSGRKMEKLDDARESANYPASRKVNAAPPLTVLWLTPMRALAADTLRALREPLPDFAPYWTSGLRTGDTPGAERAAQNRRLPTLLVTTPESLSLLLARADAPDTLRTVQLVVVDEWHELLGNKRGVQVQLALARLSGWNPRLMVWGMSATLANLDEALRTLLPLPAPAAASAPQPGKRQRTPKLPVLVKGLISKELVVDTLLPERVERFAWAGHMGLSMLPRVGEAIAQSGSTLVFTNTRSQAERWYQALLEHNPHWAGEIALHHGSLDMSVRNWVELGLKNGTLRAVVCTSSLDLGVDFLPVERVLQIGSAKGVARMLQRAGRSGHAPGRPSRITLVPTHSLEIIEAAAVRKAIQTGQIEDRHGPHQPLDVLVQHLVTVALGGGFQAEALYAEVRRTSAYEALPPDSWQWALDFVRQGGPSLVAYPDFQRAAPDADGVWRVADARLARRHRSNIGTIVSDAAMVVQFMGGGRLGTVEESFGARLRPGDVFMFAGRLLQLVRIYQMTAYVRLAKAGSAALPRWNGGRMPLSSTLADAMLYELAAAERGRYGGPEMRCVQPLLALQKKWSHLPTPQLLLAETLKSREGWHLFLYPFAGRQVHLGLAGLMAWRAAQAQANTFSIALNDYGFELLSTRPMDWAGLLPVMLALPDEMAPTSFHQPQNLPQHRPQLLAEVLASLNATELARRRFREIARIAGLIFQSHPGEKRSNRHLQASASLYYDVFQNYDPGNRLLQQAQSELLQQELDIDRLARSLERMQGQALHIVAVKKPTPLGFPLMAERFREKLSNEPLATRIARMVEELEASAGPDAQDAAAHKQGNETAPASTREAVLQTLELNSHADPHLKQEKGGSSGAGGPSGAGPSGKASVARRTRARHRRRV